MATNPERPSPYGPVKFTTIDEYHASVPENIAVILETMRKAISQAAPKATETISYNMPCFKLHNNLVYYAANKSHIGFYPSSSPMVAFRDELANFKTSKGAIQFPLDKSLPISLIKKNVKFRMVEDLSKAKTKKP